MTRARKRLVRTVLLMMVGALALSGCDFSVYSLPLPGGADLGDHPYTVKVEFRDVLDLVPQSSVKVDDVSVGRVDKITVAGNHAQVTLRLRKSVRLPDNAVAKIRQTSLLGEKFVSLSPPDSGTSSGRLGNGDVIPLARSGRNPEVEEVLGALSLLLNGGGVAQLKTISTELNKALGGRETDVKSLLSQVNLLTKRLDTHKDQIVTAIESLNRLAISLNKQKPAITEALDQLPRAVASINRQRDDLVKVLRALADLSSVGVRVISQSKTATIDSLRALAPTLTELAKSGSALPKALQVFLTYPFVDSVVGKNPAQARALHLGDYTNLSIQLDLDLTNTDLLQNACKAIPQLPSVTGLPSLPSLPCDEIPAVQKCATNVLGSGLNLTQILSDLKQCSAAAQGAICSDSSDLSSLLRQACALLNGGVLKIPKLPIKVPSLSKLAACLQSSHPQGEKCSLLSKNALLQVVSQCTNSKSQYYSSATCKAYRKKHLGINSNGILGPILGNGGGGSGGGLLGGGGGLLGLNRPAFGGSSSSGHRATKTSAESDLGALLVWGMVQR